VGEGVENVSHLGSIVSKKVTPLPQRVEGF